MIDRVIRSVLIVDDDPEFRELAGRLLAASGMTVVGETGASRRRWRLLPAWSRPRSSSTSSCPTETESRWQASSLRSLGTRGSFSPRSTGRSPPPMRPGTPALARS
jgi:hypothetical protein